MPVPRAILFFILLSLPSSAEVLHVDKSVAGGDGDGSSWENAFTHLQDALEEAGPGDELWVAESVYFPDEGANQTDDSAIATFSIGRGVRLFGGFDGTESDRGERDPDLHLTVLSGDLQQDDTNADSNHIAEIASDIQGSNSQTVVTMSFTDRNTVLDGFVVTAGNNEIRGGGLLVESREPRITRCRFSGNRGGQSGGAIQVFRADCLITNCVFSGNHAVVGGGAANFEGVTDRCILTNCLFLGNTAGQVGGAIRCSDSSPQLNSCTIAGNVAGATGGGLYLRFNSSPRFHSTIIWANEATSSNTPLSDSYRVQSGSPTFAHCIVANSNGELPSPIGPPTNIDADPRFLVQNQPGTLPDPTLLQLLPSSPAIDLGPSLSASLDGADLDGDGNTTERTPLDLAGNPRVIDGRIDAGAYESGTGPTILAQPAPLVLRPEQDQVEDAFNLSQVFDNNATSFGLFSAPTGGVLTAEVDPLTGTVDLTLLPDQLGRAQMIVNAADAEGATNYLSLVVDVFPPVFFVDADAPAGGDGLSWASAFQTLPDALRLGGSGYEIWVAEGVYYPDEGGGRIDDDPKSSFEPPDGIPLWGGFAGNETQRSSRNPKLRPTILSGDIDQNDLNTDRNSVAESVDDQAGTNAESVVRVSGAGAQMSLDGFIVTAGNGSTSHGGGMVIVDAAVDLTACVFQGNHARLGGGVGTTGSGSATITDCEFLNNDALAEGGALDNSSDGFVSLLRCRFTQNTSTRGGAISGEGRSQISASDCAFTANESSWNGGALHAGSVTLEFDSCLFHNNTGRSGGALDLSNCTGSFRNCAFSENRADEIFSSSGGAVEAFGSRTDFVACTFSSNAASNGGAIKARDCDFRIVNCVFKNHEVSSRGGAIETSDSHLAITNSLFAGNVAQNGGAIYNWIQAGPVVNCVFTANTAGILGGAIHNDVNGFPEPPPPISNSIFWKNSEAGTVDSPGASIHNRWEAGRASFSHCLLPNSGGSDAWVSAFGIDLGSNLDADPLFIAPPDPANAPAVVFDLRLQGGSPAIDAGSNSALPADDVDLDQDDDLLEALSLDLIGAPRILTDIVDLGPYESEPGPVVLGTPDPIRLAPLSGNHPALLDLSTLFDNTAIEFAVSDLTPEGIVTATVDRATGLLDLQVQPDRFGRTFLDLSAANAAGESSLVSLAIDVFPAGLRVDHKATGKGTGLTWADAFPSLHQALTAKAIPGIPLEIWVAAGRYFPDQGPGQTDDDPEATFVIPSGAHLFGGFAGTETQRSERDPARHLTILSGDLAQDDLDDDRDGLADSAADLIGTNAKHVVTGSGTETGTLLDGVVVTASAESAMLLEDALLTVRDCLFIGNVSDLGGAALLIRGAPQFEDCRFRHNTGAAGGAVHASESSPRFSRCHFEKNSVNGGFTRGGAQFFSACPATEILDCQFTENSSDDGGGAIEAKDSSLTLSRTFFDRNSAQTGGALHLDDTITTIAHCQFSLNQAGNGGAIYGFISSSTPFECSHSRFQGNSALAAGGAVNFPLLPEDQPGGTFDNCLFSGNKATNFEGGAIWSGAPLLITSCTMTGNSAGDKGGALSPAINSIVSNTIIWNNSSAGSTTIPAASVEDKNEQVTFSHCLIANSGGSASWNVDIGVDAGSNLDLDPSFRSPVLPEQAPTLAGIFLLQSGSPAINAGINPLDGSPTDLSGRVRLVDSTIDLGAYEVQAGPLDSDDDGLADEFELAHSNPPSATALDPLDDPDFDGILNLFESAFGLHPLRFDLLAMPTLGIAEVDGSNYLTLTFRRSLAATELLSFQPERSTDFGMTDDWNAGETTLLRLVPLDPLTDLVTERSISPLDAQATEQVRLRVTKE